MAKRKMVKRATAKRRAARRKERTPTARKATRPTTKKRPARSRGAGPRTHARRRTTATRRGREAAEDRGSTVGLLRDVIEHHETGPAASGGDIDADWQRAQSSGEEAVGGSVSTPDQDVVDEIGHALGVEQPPQAPVRSTEEILQDRDRRYWDLERRAAGKAARRREP